MSNWHYQRSKSPTIRQQIFFLVAFLMFGLFISYREVFTKYLILTIVASVILFVVLKLFWIRKKGQVTIGQTKQARLLWAALKERGIDAVTEYDDRHKRVDLAVLPAKLYIEIDGSQHMWNVDQAIADFRRDNYSDKDGFRTIRIPNQVVKEKLNVIADGLAQVVRERESGAKIKSW